MYREWSEQKCGYFGNVVFIRNSKKKNVFIYSFIISYYLFIWRNNTMSIHKIKAMEFDNWFHIFVSIEWILNNCDIQKYVCYKGAYIIVLSLSVLFTLKQYMYLPCYQFNSIMCFLYQFCSMISGIVTRNVICLYKRTKQINFPQLNASIQVLGNALLVRFFIV